MTNDISLRQTVLEMLLLVLKEGKSAHLVLNDVLSKYAYLPKNERSFIKRLYTGTLERRYELDYIINCVSNTKTNKMKPVILNILRMGTYEIFYMDAVPDNATCNEAVNLAGKRGFKNLKGFVNGVLRNIIRQKDSIEYPTIEDYDSYMEVRYSMPRELTSILLKDYSKEEVEAMGRASLTDRDVVIRVNTVKESVDSYKIKLEKAKIKWKSTELLNDALIIKNYGMIEELPGYEEGAFYVQDISSMQAIEALKLQPGMKVIDVCASPGGKSMAAAIIMNNQGEIVARDVSENKVLRMAENVERMGLDIIRTEVYDALILDEEKVGKMDAVIADLPCSGIGVIAKKPDIKYNVNSKEVSELSVLQGKILDTVSKYVKSGGKLLFSTCTVTNAENRDNTKKFLAGHPNFTLMEEKQILPNDVQDGFYYAVMKRK